MFNYNSGNWPFYGFGTTVWNNTIYTAGGISDATAMIVRPLILPATAPCKQMFDGSGLGGGWMLAAHRFYHYQYAGRVASAS